MKNKNARKAVWAVHVRKIRIKDWLSLDPPGFLVSETGRTYGGEKRVSLGIRSKLGQKKIQQNKNNKENPEVIPLPRNRMVQQLPQDL